MSRRPWIHNSEKIESLQHYSTGAAVVIRAVHRFRGVTGDDEISRTIGKQFTSADEAADGFHLPLWLQQEARQLETGRFPPK